jgi:hypothetical protein
MMLWRRRPDPELEQLAARLRATPLLPAPVPARLRVRARVLASVPALPAPRRRLPRAALALAAAGLLTLGGAVAAMAAPLALPGDPLYGLKRLEERIELAAAGTPERVETVRLRHATIRTDEARALEARGQAGAGPASTPDHSSRPSTHPSHDRRR